jgi:hypothetical protein
VNFLESKRSGKMWRAVSVERQKAWYLIGGLLFVFIWPLLSYMPRAWSLEGDVVEVQTTGAYKMGPGDSEKLAERLALFQAKKRAIETAAKYLSSQNLIDIHESRKREIYSLAASLIPSQVLQKQWKREGNSRECLIRIRASVGISDMIKAEKEDRKLEKKDSQESFSEEMQPGVSHKIDPARDISKAYRLLRRKEWRVAVIYLDVLEKKYPHWGDVFMAKAIFYYAVREPGEMKNALKRACRLGSDEACSDLETMSRVHGIDLED